MLLGLALSLLCASVLAEATTGTDLVILSTTDMHGRCWETNLLTGGKLSNNMLRVSTAVKDIREAYGEENVLLIDNGDLFQGNPVSIVQLTRLASGESDLPPAMALCLKEIGYDAFVLGNHEFNNEWPTISQAYRYLEENGVTVLAGNVYYDGTDPEHPAGTPAFTPYLIRTVTVNGHEHRIGILGLENSDVPRWDVSANYPGMCFSHPENDSCSTAWEVARYIPMMQAEGCELIVVAYHGSLGSSEGELVFAINSESQGARMIAETDGIALAIVGHDHYTGYSNTLQNNKAGIPVMVVNGGGKDLTKTVFHLTENEDGGLVWEITESVNLELSTYQADQSLEAMMEPYAAMAEEKISTPIGTASGDWDLSSKYYDRQTDTIDLVSAAMLSATTSRLKEKYGNEVPDLPGFAGLDHLDVDMSTTSATTSNNYVVRPGPLTIRDMYKLYRYDNTLLVLPMSGKQIKAIMEENAETHLNARIYNGEVHLFAAGGNFTNILFGGIDFTYDLSAEPGNRVLIRGFSNGRPFEEDRIYLVAVNNYLLSNHDCGLRDYDESDAIWSQQEASDGEVIQDIIAEYIQEVCASGVSLSPDLFNWHWSLEYTADPATIPPYEGEIAAILRQAPEDGHRYVIFHEPEECTLGSGSTSGQFDQVPCEVHGEVLAAPLPENALILTVRMDGEEQFYLMDSEGRYLSAQGSGGLFLVDEKDEMNMCLWEAVPVDGGYQIICVGTMKEGSDPIALEYYGQHITTYRLDQTDIYLFNFYEVLSAP